MAGERDLVAFLNACLDEDEQVAQAATKGPWFAHTATAGTDKWWDRPVTWINDSATTEGYNEPSGAQHVVSYDGGPPAGMVSPDDAAHIARHDPARVLAEVQAKRRIIDLHTHAHPHECPQWAWQDPDYPKDPAETRTGWALDGACTTLRLLALPYASYDGYRSEWAPTEEDRRGR